MTETIETLSTFTETQIKLNYGNTCFCTVQFWRRAQVKKKGFQNIVTFHIFTLYKAKQILVYTFI